jgi:hypothetical protein
MTEAVEVAEVGIYVLPTKEHQPPRALLFDPPPAVLAQVFGFAVAGAPAEFRMQFEEGLKVDGEPVNGAAVLAHWSADHGSWVAKDIPVPSELNNAITLHAQALGVEF